MRAKAEALRRCVADAALAERDSEPHATLFAAGIEEIVGRLPALERRTRRTVWNMQTALTFDPEETISPRLDDRSLGRGIQGQLLVDEYSERRNPLLVSLERGKVRVAPVFLRMLIVDESIVVCEGPRTGSGDVTAWQLRSPDLIRDAVQLWCETYAASRAIKVPGRRLLTARQLEVARALCLGETDQQLARRLHVSVRSVERDAAAVLDYLGTRSRAEAVLTMVGRGRNSSSA